MPSIGKCRGRDTKSELSARVASYEMAYRMQTSAPEAVDLSQESERGQRARTVRHERGRGRRILGDDVCLPGALVERGVRFVQLYAGGAHANDDNWDAH